MLPKAPPHLPTEADVPCFESAARARSAAILTPHHTVLNPYRLNPGLAVNLVAVVSLQSYPRRQTPHADVDLAAAHAQTKTPMYCDLPLPPLLASSCGHCTKNRSTTLLSKFPLRLSFFTRAKLST